MSFNYKTFKEHINKFNYESYLKEKSDSFKETYNTFRDFYVKIIKDEIENTRQLNAKFSKNINDKNNKFQKFNRVAPPIDLKKVCKFDNISNENEKLNIIIRTYLNKISFDTYEKVTDKLIDKLVENKNINIFKILSEEIVNKCIFDNKYRNLYINFCSKVWNNKKIHLNLVNIVKDTTSYFAVYNINDENKTLGPYESIDVLNDDVFKKINFKNFFIDFLQDLYKKKELNFDNLSDDKFFNSKKKTLLLVELLSILFIEKHINFDIINLIIIDLLHQNDNFDEIKEVEFELLYIMIRFIYKNNKGFKFIEYKKIIVTFKTILESVIINNMEISKRTKYFVEELIIIFTKIINDKKHEDNKKVVNSEDIIIEYAHKSNITEFKQNLILLTPTEQNSIFVKIINKVLEKSNDKNLISTLKNVKNSYGQLIESILKNIINNLDDIILDIPNINENVQFFIKELNLNHCLLDTLKNKVDSLDEQSDDDDFSFR